MAEKFNYGGQAVIEGVMIRGQKAVVTAMRRPTGDIVTETMPLVPAFSGKARKIPLLRGIVVLLEALIIGVKTLLASANVALEEEDTKISGASVWLLLLVSLALAVGLFFITPLIVTRLLNPFLGSALLFNIVEGLIRVGIFVAYLKVMTLMKDIRRVFEYHGAEHKVINAHEHNVPLEVSSVKAYSTVHTRCGTSFIFVVLTIAIIVFALVGKPALWLMVASRIVLVPFIAALGYEFIYFAARHTGSPWMKILTAPGLWLQSFTTREPDDSQLEVALTSLKKALAIDAGVPEVEVQPGPQQPLEPSV